jgi:tRNA 2-thiocytidine biosynthesis protein TtcA
MPAMTPEQRARRIQSRLLLKLKKAVRELALPLEGARVLIGASGGWDSYALTLLLHAYRRGAKHKPELFAAYAAFQGAERTPPSEAFLQFYAKLGIPLLTLVPDSHAGPCHVCRLKRRELLVKAASHLGCRLIALGHHLEDFGETLLLNLLFAGTFEGLFPTVDYFGRFMVVRPLLYLRKEEINALGRTFAFPPTHAPCADYAESKRMPIRAFLQQLSRGNKHVFWNLLRARMRASTPPQSRKAAPDSPRCAH